MAQKTNSFERYWKELKRRKVVHVITVYAATAFVIIELVSMVARPLKLPEWTEAFVIILLCIGFIISVFVSWVYDITPAGVRKTKPVSELKHVDHTTHEISSRWKVATYISAVIIVALVAFNFISRGNLNADISKLEKSIAVLPFINDSPDESNTYFINGIMENILDNLCKIQNLTVIARTSVEQYRNAPKNVTEIAKELNVSFILEGSGQKYEDKIRLIVQLINGKNGKHIWSNQYNRELKDIFDIQSEVSQIIASELKAIITPEEKHIIELIPTDNLTALDCYLRALEEHNRFNENQTDYKETENELERAILLYQLTLEYDSTYAQAYTGLAKAYKDKYYNKTYFKDNFLDSTLTLANIALSYNSKLEEAYKIRADYYYDYGMYNEALKEYKLVLKINPNYWSAYSGITNTYIQLGDYVSIVENYQKAIKLNRGKELPELLRRQGDIFDYLEMEDIAKSYYMEAFRLDHDTLALNNDILVAQNWQDYKRGKILFVEDIEKVNKILEIDSTLDGSNLYRIAYANSVLGNHKEAYKYWSEYAKRTKESGRQLISVSHRVGYAYWQAGYKEEAKKYFDEHLFHCKESIKLNREYANRMGATYDLAGYYAFLGDKEKAYQYLNEFLNNLNYFGSYWFKYILYDPMFNNIREEERFKNIIRDMENKSQKERERVKKWLEEQGMLWTSNEE